jgi:prophage regulatory protein
MPKSSPRRLIGRAELQRRVPYSLTHVWRLEQKGEFPKRIPIGKNRVGWDEEEVAAWIEDRILHGKKIVVPGRRTPPVPSSGEER